MTCTATGKRTHERCNANAVTGRTVCYHHGGRSPAGIASATYVHGDRSKYLPNRLLKRYRGAMTDPELLDLSVDLFSPASPVSTRPSTSAIRAPTVAWMALLAARDGLRAARRAKATPGPARLCLGGVGDRDGRRGPGGGAGWSGARAGGGCGWRR